MKSIQLIKIYTNDCKIGFCTAFTVSIASTGHNISFFYLKYYIIQAKNYIGDVDYMA